MKLKAKKSQRDARLPSYGNIGDAGLDLFSSVDCEVKRGEIKSIPTGIKLAVPEGYVGLIWDKSGLSLRGIHRMAGVVDSGYRGEVKVVIVNIGKKKFIVKKGMKIAQLLIQPVVEAKVEEVEELDETLRGEKGFGSTGKY